VINVEGPNDVVSPTTVYTNAAGIASFEYTGAGSGADYIYATGKLKKEDVADDYAYPFFCSALKEWY
jgi:hypothetical protein